jgi:hypothetical protein
MDEGYLERRFREVLEDTEKENRNDCGQMKGLEYF